MGLLNSGKLTSMRSAALEDFYIQAQSILVNATMFMGGSVHRNRQYYGAELVGLEVEASVRQRTFFAFAKRSVLAHSFSVAPVVKTSSTKRLVLVDKSFSHMTAPLTFSILSKRTLFL